MECSALLYSQPIILYTQNAIIKSMAPPEEQILKAVDQIMDQIIDEIFAESQQNLLDDDKYDTGFLFKTANVNRKFLEKEIVYPANYAETVHYGRNPGSMPPPQALEKWVRRKLKVPKKDVRHVAFKIAMSIKQRGIMPTPYLERAVESVIAKLGG